MSLAEDAMIEVESVVDRAFKSHLTCFEVQKKSENMSAWNHDTFTIVPTCDAGAKLARAFLNTSQNSEHLFSGHPVIMRLLNAEL